MATNGNEIHPTSSADEKDFGNHEHLDHNTDEGTALKKIQTAGSISITPELFEKLYLSPRDAAASGSIRRVVGNPTPIALVGFLMAFTPFSNDLMGWRGAGQANGAASTGAFLYFGGLVMVLGAFGEFLVGNTFPSVVFMSFGGFWLTYGATLQDGFYGAQSAYTMHGTVPMEQATADFYNAFSFVLLWMGILCLIYLVASVRTNVCFVMIFFTLVLAFGFLSGAFWQIAEGNTALGLRLVKGGGACGFVTCVFGWWIFAAILLGVLDHPIQLPVGDLSGIVKGKDELRKGKRGGSEA